MSSVSRTCVCLAVLTAALLCTSVPSASGDSFDWQPAVLLEFDDAEDIFHNSIAMDDLGNALVIWVRWDGISFTIWANRYDVVSGWGEAVAISEENVNMVTPSVAMDRSGNGLVAWDQFDDDSSTRNLWMNLYEAGKGWSTPMIVEDLDDGGVSYPPDVASDLSGNFFIIWSQSDGTVDNALCRIYNPESGLGDLWVLDDSETEDAQFPEIGTDSSGRAIAVWRQTAGSSKNLVSCSYDPQVGWDTPGVVEYDNIVFGTPVLSVEPGGNATCAWQHMKPSGYYEIRGSHYNAGSGWSIPAVLRTLTNANAMDPDVASVGCGESVVVWHEWGPGSLNGVCFAEYDSASGWSSVSVAAYSDDGLASSPSIASSAHNEAVMLFKFSITGMFIEVWAIPYSTSGGWGQQVKLSSPDMGDVNQPMVCANGAGDAAAVWQQSNGVLNNLWGSYKAGPDTTPPALSISSPFNGEVLGIPVVTVEGTTEPGVTLAVNGILALVEHDGSFSVDLPLLEGENAIHAIATDSSGNTASASLTVIYVPPPNPLEDDLEDAVSTIVQLWDQLNQSMEDINSTISELTATLGQMREVLNQTLADLAETDDALADAEEKLEDTEDRIDTLSSQGTMLMALLVVVAVLFGVVSLMYLQVRKALRGLPPE